MQLWSVVSTTTTTTTKAKVSIACKLIIYTVVAVERPPIIIAYIYTNAPCSSCCMYV